LIDTHITKKNVENQWHTDWGYDAYFSSYASNSKGVSILFKNTFEFKIHRDIKDKNGNFIILVITVSDYRFTLVAVYGPNEDNPECVSNLYSNMILCENTSIISVSDWNVVQNYEKDILNYVNQNNHKSQETLYNIMNELDIHDNRRIQNPDVPRFSWRGPGGRGG
jgi:exonuclease III